MMWPLTSEAKRLEDEKKRRQKSELDEVSGRIKKLSIDIAQAMNGHKMLPLEVKKK